MCVIVCVSVCVCVCVWNMLPDSRVPAMVSNIIFLICADKLPCSCPQPLHAQCLLCLAVNILLILDHF